PRHAGDRPDRHRLLPEDDPRAVRLGRISPEAAAHRSPAGYAAPGLRAALIPSTTAQSPNTAPTARATSGNAIGARVSPMRNGATRAYAPLPGSLCLSITLSARLTIQYSGTLAPA